MGGCGASLLEGVGMVYVVICVFCACFFIGQAKEMAVCAPEQLRYFREEEVHVV